MQSHHADADESERAGLHHLLPAVVVDQLRQLGDALYRHDDELARARGWRVTAGKLGLTRTYRHPGFDRLSRRVGARLETPRGYSQVGR